MAGRPPEGRGPAASGPIVVPLAVEFEQPLSPATRLFLVRLGPHLLRHVFEIHDLGPAGESITRIAVADHIAEIDLCPGADVHLAVEITALSKAARPGVIWLTALLFRYLHYHVARIRLIDGRPHQLDWEARQDPQLPARVRRWVEGGLSIIERLHTA